jgi:hypothetical protein
MSDLKLNPRVKPSPYTGSAFDVTLTGTIKERPGGHFSGPSLPIDVSAFSHSKKTFKVDPHEYVKKGTGLGGTVMVNTSSSHVPSSHHPISHLLFAHHHHHVLVVQGVEVHNQLLLHEPILQTQNSEDFTREVTSRSKSITVGSPIVSLGKLKFKS